MSPLTTRRIIVWAVSMFLGVVLTLATLTFFFPWKNGEVVSVAQYGKGYFILTTFAIGMIFVTILDYFMDTKIWPD